MSTKSNVGPTRKRPAASGESRATGVSERAASSGANEPSSSSIGAIEPSASSIGAIEPSASSTGANEPDLRQLYDVAVKSATREDEQFLQKLHALGHYPRESRSRPQEEQQLAMQARDRQRRKSCNVHIRAYLAALRKHSALHTNEDNIHKAQTETRASERAASSGAND